MQNSYESTENTVAVPQPKIENEEDEEASTPMWIIIFCISIPSLVLIAMTVKYVVRRCC